MHELEQQNARVQKATLKIEDKDTLKQESDTVTTIRLM